MSNTLMETLPRVVPENAILSNSIVNLAGNVVKVDDLMLDLEKGRAAYTAFSFAAGLESERNKDLCRRFIQKILNEGEVSLIWDFMSPDVVNHELTDSFGDSDTPEVHNIEWMVDLIHLYRHAFPDLRFEIQDQIAEGSRVVTRLRMRGTQTNRLMAIAASGRQIDIAGIRVDRLAGGRIVESWFYLDTLSMLQQIGALPPLNRRPQKVEPAGHETAPGVRLPSPQQPLITYIS